MHNILPPTKTGRLIDKHSQKLNSWNPSDANAITGKVPASLESEMTVEVRHVQRYAQNRVGQKPPNEKHIDPIAVARIAEEGPSEISKLKRGVADKPEINYVPPKLTQYGRPKDKNTGVANYLVLRMINILPTPMDLFVQKELSIHSSVSKPQSISVRTIAGVGTLTAEIVEEHSFSLMFSTVRVATVTTTALQEIQDFIFRTNAKIGMEIELVGNRLVCTKVLPETQASTNEVAFDGCEIIAVNDVRVLNLEQFQEAVIAGQQYDTVVLKIAAYRGGRGRHEDLFFMEEKKSKQVKNLFANITLGSASRDDISRGDSTVDGDDDDDELEEEPSSLVRSESKGEAKDENDATSESSSYKYQPYQSNRPGADSPSLTNDADSKSSALSRRGRKSMFSKVTSDLHYDDDEDEDEEDEGEGGVKGSGTGSGSGDPGDDDISKMSEDDALSRAGSKLSSVRKPVYFLDDDEQEEEDLKGEGDVEGFDQALDGAEYEDVENENGGMMAGRKKREAQENVEKPVVIAASGSLSTSLAIEDEKEKDEEDIDNRSAQTADSTDSWDFPTAIRADVFPFMTLTCLPGFISRSLRWGKPVDHIQFSNFSRNWNLTVFWVDEDGALVQRAEVKVGDHHFELVSTEHVWVVMGTPLKQKKQTHYDGTQTILTEVDKHASPSLMIVRPSVATLHKSKCTSVMWAPQTSMSITRRVYSAKVSDARQQNLSGTVVGDVRATQIMAKEVQPQIHLQMFDGATPTHSHNHKGTGSTAADSSSASYASGATGLGDSRSVSAAGGAALYAKNSLKLPKWPRKNPANAARPSNSLRK